MARKCWFVKKPVLRVNKDRHDSKSGQIVFDICYNVTYMDQDTAKFSRFKWFKFVLRIISIGGIRKCHHFNPKLPMVASASSFTTYLIYVLYGPQYGQNKQIGAKN